MFVMHYSGMWVVVKNKRGKVLSEANILPYTN